MKREAARDAQRNAARRDDLPRRARVAVAVRGVDLEGPLVGPRGVRRGWGSHGRYGWLAHGPRQPTRHGRRSTQRSTRCGGGTDRIGVPRQRQRRAGDGALERDHGTVVSRQHARDLRGTLRPERLHQPERRERGANSRRLLHTGGKDRGSAGGGADLEDSAERLRRGDDEHAHVRSRRRLRYRRGRRSGACRERKGHCSDAGEKMAYRTATSHTLLLVDGSREGDRGITNRHAMKTCMSGTAP